MQLEGEIRIQVIDQDTNSGGRIIISQHNSIALTFYELLVLNLIRFLSNVFNINKVKRDTHREGELEE